MEMASFIIFINYYVTVISFYPTTFNYYRTQDKKNRMIELVRVPTSSENQAKPGKSLEKSSMHGKLTELKKNKNINNHGKTMEFCEII